MIALPSIDNLIQEEVALPLDKLVHDKITSTAVVAYSRDASVTVSNIYVQRDEAFVSVSLMDLKPGQKVIVVFHYSNNPTTLTVKSVDESNSINIVPNLSLKTMVHRQERRDKHYQTLNNQYNKRIRR